MMTKPSGRSWESGPSRVDIGVERESPCSMRRRRLEDSTSLSALREGTAMPVAASTRRASSSLGSARSYQRPRIGSLGPDEALDEAMRVANLVGSAGHGRPFYLDSKGASAYLAAVLALTEREC